MKAALRKIGRYLRERFGGEFSRYSKESVRLDNPEETKTKSLLECIAEFYEAKDYEFMLGGKYSADAERVRFDVRSPKGDEYSVKLVHEQGKRIKVKKLDKGKKKNA